VDGLTATGVSAYRALSKAELRSGKQDREAFLRLPRRPITVVLDGVRQNYNLGAIFRLCDAFLVERLIICGTRVELHKRKLVQAARGTQRWEPWRHRARASDAIDETRSAGAWIVAAEQTTASVAPERLAPRFPACLILGSEEGGVSAEAVAGVDAAVAIPMLGMANSLNVASTAAILIHWLSLQCSGELDAGSGREQNDRFCRMRPS